MGLDAPLLLVKDRPDRKIALEVLEGLFDLDKLEKNVATMQAALKVSARAMRVTCSMSLEGPVEASP